MLLKSAQFTKLHESICTDVSSIFLLHESINWKGLLFHLNDYVNDVLGVKKQNPGIYYHTKRGGALSGSKSQALRKNNHTTKAHNLVKFAVKNTTAKGTEILAF